MAAGDIWADIQKGMAKQKELDEARQVLGEMYSRWEALAEELSEE